MKSKRLLTKRTVMAEQAMNAAYRRLIRENTGHVRYAIGIFLGDPFSLDRDKQRHYIALDKAVEANTPGETLTLQGGYYSPLTVTGDFNVLTAEIFKSYKRDIEPSSYRVASTIFFESIRLPDRPEDFDYFASTRTVFRCLTRR